MAVALARPHIMLAIPASRLLSIVVVNDAKRSNVGRLYLFSTFSLFSFVIVQKMRAKISTITVVYHQPRVCYNAALSQTLC